jgi:glycosyltransferase involved in cell wall biosynthesis
MLSAPLAKMSGDKSALPAEITIGSRRVKVLHVGKFYPPYRGGIETHLQVLSGELRKSLDLSVIVSNSNRRTTREVVEGVSVLRVATPVMLSSAPICPAMVSHMRASDADIVHLHLPNPTAILAYLASGHRGRLVLSYHSDIIRQKFLGSLFEPFMRAAARRSSAIIASSANYLKSSPFLTGFRDRCDVIPYGIDVSQLGRDPAAGAHMRRHYGERLIVSVGRLVYYKGFEFLIRAMAQVRGKLIIIGDGPLRGQLRGLASRIGVADRVFFVGEVPDTIPYYQAADVFALASVARAEAFGIVQIEAMAAGLPVVNTQLDSGVPFVSLHGQTGLTVPPSDPAAMAAALNRLLDDPQLRQLYGQAARRRAQEEFSREVMASRTLRLYERVMAS